MNILDIVKDVGGLQQAKDLLHPFLKKLERMFPKDLQQMTPGEITKALAELNAELTAINTRLIQLHTQIEQKEKEIKDNLEILKEKFGVDCIEALQKKQEEAKAEFDRALAELRQTQKTIEESEALIKTAGPSK